MGNWKTLAWWEHLGLQIGSQAPAVIAFFLGASNPVTLGISAAAAIGTAIYTLAHSNVGNNIIAKAAGDSVNAAAGVDWSHPTAQTAVAAAQAIAVSLQKITTSLPPPVPMPLPTPAPAPVAPVAKDATTASQGK